MSRKLLVINPNTTTDITGRMIDVGRELAPRGIMLVPQNGRFGARYISDRPSFVVAGHAALDAYAIHAGQVDGVLLACFGDPGLMALQEIAGVPVLGLAQASFAAAGAGGRRFGIVTGGVRWRPMLEQLAGELGHADSLACIETLTMTGGEIAADPDGAIAALAEACSAAAGRGAEAVILGGAGLVRLAARVQPLVQVPVVCSVTAGFEAAFAALEAPPATRRDFPTVPSDGLSPELAAVLARGGPVRPRG
jgi:allantoin racemase